MVNGTIQLDQIENLFLLKPTDCLKDQYPEYLGGPRPSQNSGQGTTTGMGSAPPPGGAGAGSIIPSNSLSNQSISPQQTNANYAGRFHVRVSSNGTATPFTGVTDAGGYFFVPFIPEGQPFTAVALDTATGERRTFEGIGPKTGESTYMFFDFTPLNNPPVANAGNNQSSTANTPVNLDASASSDPDEDFLVYTWEFTSKPSGSNATLTSTDTVTTSFTPDVEGEYKIKLTVSDFLDEDTDTITILVGNNQSNNPPTADAGINQTVLVDSEVALDGSASSDPDGDTLTYDWAFNSKPNGSGASLSNSTTPTPTFIADVAGDYQIDLTVSDSKLNDTDSITITAKECAAPLEVSGTISSDETWAGEAGCVDYRVTGGLDVSAKLTIFKGVTIEFAKGAYIDISSNGSIMAEGTSEEPIIFTGSEETPGHWSGISFYNGGAGIIKHAKINYAGYDDGFSTQGAIDLSGSSPTLQNIHIDSAKATAISADATDSPIIENITISNTPKVGLELQNHTIGKDTTWSQTAIPYLIGDQLLSVLGSTTLTIDPNVIVKFSKASNSYISVSGTLNVNGTAGNEVYFTSINDDTVGGDTNSDQDGTIPSPRDWSGIYFNSGSAGTIKNAEIRYADIGTYNGTPNITNSKLTRNNHGVYSDGAGENPTVSQSCFIDNVQFGAFATNGGTINAENNYWNSSDGPSGEGPGSGDAVSQGVDFQPFLDACP